MGAGSQGLYWRGLSRDALALTGVLADDTISLAEGRDRPFEAEADPAYGTFEGRRACLLEGRPEPPLVHRTAVEMSSFFERLEARQSLLCIGLDPDLAQMPEGLPSGPEGVVGFHRQIIEATADLVCAYKPNLAFYEAMGIPGLEALRGTLDAIPKDIPVIGDAKRGDVGHTARAYASALFDYWRFDAVTVNPYLGGDAVAPFVERADRGVFVVCRTSNPGAGDLQDLGVASGEPERPLRPRRMGLWPMYVAVADLARSWNSRGNVGLVVGATYPEEMGRLRELCPEMTFLVPGVGAQGGNLEATLRRGLAQTGGPLPDSRGRGLIISISRQVIYASQGGDFAEAARREALALRDEIERVRRGAVGTGLS